MGKWKTWLGIVISVVAIAWAARGVEWSEVLPALADAVFDVEPGNLSDIIETEDGFYLVQVHGKETRELEEATRLRLATSMFNERLEEAATQHELQNLVTVEQAQRIADHLRSSGG